MKKIFMAVVGFLGLAVLAGSARADQPGRHPAYLHALEDLRHARGHLERPAGTPQSSWDERVAIGEIDAAIHEIRQAAIDDGKNLADHPAVDAKLDWPGRLHRAAELLRKARADINEEEDNAFARGLKRRAAERIDAAIRFVDQGIAQNQGPPPGPPPGPGGGRHPAYLHALEDLRHARAHLERPANLSGATRWDERVAVAKIDAAIREIKEAAIDDGKDLGDHPPIDVKLDWPGRLHRALELLKKARVDINEEEDNDFARGLKRRAREHIDGAINFVEQGIAQNR